MIYHIKLDTNKAKNDVNTIVERMGVKPITHFVNPADVKLDHPMRFIIKVWAMLCILAKMRKGDVLFLQYPLKKFYVLACVMAHLRQAKVITLIHDLSAFRKHKITPDTEVKMLNHSDTIIVHNASMRTWLEDHGCKAYMVELDIFDYITDAVPSQNVTPHHPYQVILAGGLSERRSKFLYQLNDHFDHWQLRIYGPGYDQKYAKGWQSVSYCGCLPPDTLVKQVEGDFGLVWDGDSVYECCGDWGSYLKTNNPHKASFALRVGMPVITWNQAAIAPFILKYHAGIIVDSLRDIDNTLQAITPEEYATLRANAQKLQQLLADGHFTRTAIEKCLQHLGYQQ